MCWFRATALYRSTRVDSGTPRPLSTFLKLRREEKILIIGSYTQERILIKELDRITIDPKICLGEPTIRGMRITVSIVLKQIAAGTPTQEIRHAYPELEEEDVRQALRYAAWLASEKTRPIPVSTAGGA
jgi:uncharacterized protein (DUF433 family)